MPADNESPRVTIRMMTDYLTAPGAHQRFTVIQSMKSNLGRRHFAPYYQTARSVIRNYHSGQPDALSEAIQRLGRERRDANTPNAIAKIDNNLRVLGDYRDQFGNVDFAHRGMRFAPLMINGVRISVEPTLSGTLRDGRAEFECNITVDTQADSPVDDEIDYVLELLYRGSGVSHETPLKGAQYWHPGSGDVWYLERSKRSLWRNIEEAAREIALRWPTIEG